MPASAGRIFRRIRVAGARIYAVVLMLCRPMVVMLASMKNYAEIVPLNWGDLAVSGYRQAR